MDLVVDLGQSGARIRIGDVITPLNSPKRGTETVVDALVRVFDQVPAQDFDTVFLSLTGLFGDVKDPNPYGELCAKYFNAKNVCVMDDGIAAYVGALGDRSGIALALGGGVVAVSAHAGRFGHADGKGAIFGDLGGGFWVGQSGLRRAIATLDGRDDAYDLVELLQDELSQYAGLSDMTGAPAATLCISAARTVALGAENGLSNAQEILTTGASFLAKTVRAAWHKVGQDAGVVPALALLGGVAKSPFYAQAIHAAVAALMPCDFVSPASDHLAGAPVAGRLYPEGVSPLLKWWRA